MNHVFKCILMWLFIAVILPVVLIALFPALDQIILDLGGFLLWGACVALVAPLLVLMME